MKKLFYILTLFTSVNSFGQTDAENKIQLGIEQFEKANYKEAENYFSQAIALGKDSAVLKSAYIKKGLTLNQLKEFQKAILCFDIAFELDPKDLLTLVDRGTTYLYLNDIQKGKQDFHRIISLSTKGKSAEASYYFLGRISIEEGDFENAIKYLNLLLEMIPTDYEAYFLRGVAKGNRMDFDGAIADYDKAIKYNPKYMEAYANRGTMKLNKIPIKDKIKENIDCLTEPCEDLLKAKQFGDTEIDELISLYCKKCK